MALIHYLYVGDFVPESGLVRFQDHRPFARRTINMDAVARLLRKYLGESASPDNLPGEWGMSILPDYIVCVYGGPPSALRFVADYAQQEGATIVDMGSFSLLTPEQLRQSTVVERQTQPA